MPERDSTAPATAHSSDALTTLRRALSLLECASSDWRHCGPSDGSAPLYWPAAIGAAKAHLAFAMAELGDAQALDALTERLHGDGSALAMADEPRISAERSHPRHRSHPSVADLRELLTEAAERLQGWSAGAGPDGRLIGRIRQALGAEAPRGASAQAAADAGMAWWNGISRDERAYWLCAADSARPADAWAAYRASIEPPERGRLREEIELARAATESLP